MNIEKLIKKPSRTDVDYYVTVDGDTVDDAIDFSIEAISRQARVFGKEGDDAEGMLRDNLGDDQFDRLLQHHVMTRLAPFVIEDETDLNMALEPQCASDEIPHRGESFTFKIHVLLRPTCILTSYDPVEVTVSRYIVTDEAVDKRIAQLAAEDPDYAEAAADAEVADDVRNQVRSALEKEAEHQSNLDLSVVVDAMLASRLQGKIPDELYESAANSVYANLLGNLNQQGKTLSQFASEQGLDKNQIRMQVAMQAKSIVVQGLALDKLFDMKIGKLEDQDIEDAYRSFAPGNEEEAKRQFEESGRLYAVREVARRLAAHRWLLETAKVTYEDADMQV